VITRQKQQPIYRMTQKDRHNLGILRRHTITNGFRRLKSRGFIIIIINNVIAQVNTVSAVYKYKVHCCVYYLSS